MYWLCAIQGTRVEGMVNKLFEGHVFNYIECINVDCKSTRTEAFQDLQLDVKGCKNIYESFDKYCDVEVLDGDNKYEAEGHGKQAARKGVLFDDVPPVLQLQLKRFEYDYMKDMMIKVGILQYSIGLDWIVLVLCTSNKLYITYLNSSCLVYFFLPPADQ